MRGQLLHGHLVVLGGNVGEVVLLVLLVVLAQLLLLAPAVEPAIGGRGDRGGDDGALVAPVDHVAEVRALLLDQDLERRERKS